MHILNIILLCLLWILIAVISLAVLLIIIILSVRLNLYVRINNEKLKVRFKIFCFTVFDTEKEMNNENKQQSLDIMSKVSEKLSKNKKNNDDFKEKSRDLSENEKNESYFSNKMNESPQFDDNKVADDEKDEKTDNNFTKDDIFDIIKIGFETLKKIVKRFAGSIKINKLYFNLLISTNDAAKTAVFFGNACSLYYPFLEFLKNRVKIRDEYTNIFVDYETGKSKADVTCDAVLYGTGALYTALPLLKFYFKYKKIKKRNKKGGAENE